jgi:hypothetical protein
MHQFASEPEGYRLNSEQHLHISWRAILAGIVVALAVDVLLSLLGFAVGLTAFEPTAGAAKGVGTGIGIWLIITAIASVFAGAYFGARVAGDPWRGDGVAHGLMVWAGFVLLSVWLVGSGAGKILNTATGLAGSAMSGMMTPEGRMRGAGPALRESPTLREAPSFREPATQQQAAEAAKKAADQAAAGGAVASWVGFSIALLSLAGGAFGGMLGAIGEQKQVGRYMRRREEHHERIAPTSTPIQPMT